MRRIGRLALAALLGLRCGGVAAPAANNPPALAAAPTARPGPLVIAFEMPAAGATSPFVRPWPSELGRRADGRIDISRFPGTDQPALVGMFAETAPQITGFSTRPVIYFRFIVAEHNNSDAAVVLANKALSSLPQQLDAALKRGVFKLLDVDPTSPERGRTVPLQVRHLANVSFVAPDTVALRPKEPLRPNTLYIAVVLRHWGDEWPQLGTNLAFEQLKARTPLQKPGSEVARVMHMQALDWLQTHEIPREKLAAVALFRTQAVLRPVRAMVAAVEQLENTKRAPKVLSLRPEPGFHGDGFWAYRGYYCTPNFQTALEHAPFMTQGGSIVTAANGRAVVQDVPPTLEEYAPECAGSLRARFTLSVPKAPQPPQGWRLMVYAHGTSGGAHSMFGSTGFAALAARAGVATVSTDQPLHGGDDEKGARPGSRTPFQARFGGVVVPVPSSGRGSEVAFYNFLRPPILRDNIRQAVADSASLVRAVLRHRFDRPFESTSAEPEPYADGAPDVSSLRFDRAFGYIAAGHSQGTDTALPLGANDPLASAVVLSAAGGDVAVAALGREDSKPILRIVGMVLGLRGSELDEFHPFATLFQTVLDPVDLQNHGAALRRGMAPSARSVLLINGKDDSMTVLPAVEALAVSLRAAPLGALAEPMPLLAEFGIVSQPQVAANGNGGRSTFALLDMAPNAGEDGHFVVFSLPLPRQKVVQFLSQVSRSSCAPRLRR